VTDTQTDGQTAPHDGIGERLGKNAIRIPVNACRFNCNNWLKAQKKKLFKTEIYNWDMKQ